LRLSAVKLKEHVKLMSTDFSGIVGWKKLRAAQSCSFFDRQL